MTSKNEPDVRWDAADYARHSSAQEIWAREMIERLGLRGDERVLDIGCGDGKVTARIAEGVPRGSVLGIDSSEDMVALAERSHPGRVQNLTFARMDARDIRLEQKFDLVFSAATLHWVRDHRPVLRGIAAVLAPGGRVLLQMGGRGNAAEVVAVMDRVLARPEWAEHFVSFRFPYGFYGPEEYEPWLREAGLVPVRVVLVPKRMLQPGAPGLAGWIRTTWLPYTQRVPEERRDALVQAVTDAYLAEHPPEKDGTVAVEMVRLEVEATRREDE
jgi:trans-aconitate 2-methyltransferase